MQKQFHPITPQKITHAHFAGHDDHLLKELSPLMLTVISSSQGKIAKLEMLQSPLPANKDLFSQLLGTEIKNATEDCLQNYQIMEEESYENVDDVILNNYASEQESSPEDENDEEYDQNGVKKRKRKSTAQIKMLKLELEVEGNWSKQKIVEMSEITGLSQSQVYKWWWDQKKKNAKNERDSLSRMTNKRKPIRKDLLRRPFYQQNKLNSHGYDPEEEAVHTKAKNVGEIDEVPETEKKINKRLVFF